MWRAQMYQICQRHRGAFHCDCTTSAIFTAVLQSDAKKKKENRIYLFVPYHYTHGEHGGDIWQQRSVSLFCSPSHDCSRRLLGK